MVKKENEDSSSKLQLLLSPFIFPPSISRKRPKHGQNEEKKKEETKYRKHLHCFFISSYLVVVCFSHVCHFPPDMTKVLELDPSNDQARRNVVRLKPLADEKREKMKEEMIGKLAYLMNFSCSCA